MVGGLTVDPHHPLRALYASKSLLPFGGFVTVTPIRSLLLIAFVLVLPGTQLAYAQASSTEQLIEAGVAARRAGNDEQALALFTRAWDVGHSPRARVQMALAEQALGNFIDAQGHLAEALAASGDAWIDERRPALEESLRAVRARLGRLDVRVDQPGALLRLNGRDAGTLPLAGPMPVMPGTITVTVSARGFAPSTRSVVVTAGQLSRERFELVPLAVVAATTTPVPVAPAPSGATIPADHANEPTRPSRSPLSTIGWVAGGIGVVGVGLGVVFYAQSASAASRYNDDARCLVGGATREENCGSFAADARSAQTLMAVSFIGGGLFLGGGLALVLLGGRSGEAEAPPTRAIVACAPVFGSVVGVGCEGRF